MSSSTRFKYLLFYLCILFVCLNCRKELPCLPEKLVSNIVQFDDTTRAFLDVYKDKSTLVFVDSFDDSIKLNKTALVAPTELEYLFDYHHCTKDDSTTMIIFKTDLVCYEFTSDTGDSLLIKGYNAPTGIRNHTAVDYYPLAYIDHMTLDWKSAVIGLVVFDIWLNNGGTDDIMGISTSDWGEEGPQHIEYFEELTINGFNYTQVYKYSIGTQGTTPQIRYFSLNKGLVAFLDKPNEKFWMLKNMY